MPISPLADLMCNIERPRTAKRLEFLNYVFTTAEINYWSQAANVEGNYRNDGDDDAGFYYLIESNDPDGWGLDDELTSHLRAIGRLEPGKGKNEQHWFIKIDIDVVEMGIMRFWEHCLGARDICGRPEGHPDFKPDKCHAIPEGHYWWKFLVQDLTNGEDGDSDSDVCDTIIQLGLFDEVVYA